MKGRGRYTPPAIDSVQAVADAKTFLCSARSIDAVTVESIVRMHRLSPRQAEYLLTLERQRRAV